MFFRYINTAYGINLKHLTSDLSNPYFIKKKTKV